jgi:hypothetical protein
MTQSQQMRVVEAVSNFLRAERATIPMPAAGLGARIADEEEWPGIAPRSGRIAG